MFAEKPDVYQGFPLSNPANSGSTSAFEGNHPTSTPSESPYAAHQLQMEGGFETPHPHGSLMMDEHYSSQGEGGGSYEQMQYYQAHHQLTSPANEFCNYGPMYSYYSKCRSSPYQRPPGAAATQQHTVCLNLAQFTKPLIFFGRKRFAS